MSEHFLFQRGEKTDFDVLNKDDLDQELSPEEVEEQDACNSQEVKDVASPFSNMLNNLLNSGGRSRRARVQGETDSMNSNELN